MTPAASRACGICGTPAPPPFRVPPPQAAPDLDERPGEPARSTLRRWVQQCRHCHACAPDLAALPAAAMSRIDAAYLAEPSPFMRWAMLMTGSPAEGSALLQAAWEADDDGRDATLLRSRAAAALSADNVPAALRRVDVLRRAGDFPGANAALAAIPSRTDETSGQIIAFQRQRLAAHDAARYLISSAIRPAARRPHASHGVSARPAGKGLLSWLLRSR